MSNDPIKLLKMNQEKYSQLIDELEEAVDNAIDLDLEVLDELEGELNSFEKIVFSIKTMTQDITKKIFRYKAKHDKKTQKIVKEKDSLEFNEIMLFQGKSAKYLAKIEERALNGEIDAQYILGKTYLQGIIGNYGELKMKDVSLGLKWLTQAYKKGHLDSGYLIALHEKTLFNTEKCIEILETLSEKNHLKSLNELSIIYQKDNQFKNTEKLLKIKQKLHLIE